MEQKTWVCAWAGFIAQELSQLGEIMEKPVRYCNTELNFLQEKLRQKEKQLHQLEKQEKDFLGIDKHNEGNYNVRHYTTRAARDIYLILMLNNTVIHILNL